MTITKEILFEKINEEIRKKGKSRLVRGASYLFRNICRNINRLHKELTNN